MPPIEKRWQTATPLTPEAEENLEKFRPVLRQILFNRGYATQTEALDFLQATQPKNASPEGLKGIDVAVDRIERAIADGENIVVYGDYDADGVCATALMIQALNALGAEARGYIPDRFEEGYGLNNEALQALKEEGADLVISVDCGIRAVEEANYARQLHLDLIITDHHNPGPELPDATALINPKQPGDSYPNKNLAGVGTAYKLACALLERHPAAPLAPHQLLDLVALGTIADLVPLVGENRALVREGLNRIQSTHRQGLQSLIGVSGLKPKQVNAGHVGYVLGPRLNAAGRVASALDAYRLLLTDDVFLAGKLAQDLDNFNRERQKITREIIEGAEQLAFQDDPEALLLFAADPDFNPGVVGLAASNLAERYYRPAIVGQRGEEYTRASCRSIPEFHITEALDQCADLLDHFGGHAAAAGFTVQNHHLPDLLRRLNHIAQKQLSRLDLRPTLNAEAEVSLSDLRPELLQDLELLQPTGYGNPDPFFVTRDLEVRSSRAVGKESNHLKLIVSDGWMTIDAIAFRQGHWATQLPSRVDLLYAFELNEYNGRKTLQLNVQDIKPTGE